MRQADVCEGWDKWIAKLKATDLWKEAPNEEFPKVEALVDRIVGGEQHIQAKLWPKDQCDKCVDRSADNFDILDFLDSVWPADYAIV